MRSLFLKIFLWFWLAMALVVSVFVVLVATTQEERSRREERGSGPRRLHEMMGEALTIYLQTAAHTLEHDGHAALQGYFKRLEQAGRIRTFLYDEHGVAILRPAKPLDAKPHHATIDERALSQLVKRAAGSDKPELILSGPVLLAAQRATARATGHGQAKGRHYVIVGAMPGLPFRPPMDGRRGRGRGGGGPYQWWVQWLFAEPNTQILRLLVVLVTTGIVCYGLVRHLTAPIIQLRTATHRLAAGDLTTRVGATLGRRRDELGVLGRDFDLMAARIESLMNAQHRLIADISHELRSPLARLSVALGLVRDTAGAEAAEDLDRIELEAGRLNTMIGQLLTLSRLESGEQVAEHTPINVPRLVQEIAADADFEARSRQGSVQVVASVECVTTGTESLLRSAIENVVRNAVRYTHEGTTVEISLSRERPAEAGAEHVVIRVRDHGPGVPEEALAHLFRPFYRVADARDRQTGGTGLGLAITERAVRLHNGTVTAANAPDGGLLVEIRLPIARVT